jgi:hypothetical protein
MFYTLTYFGFYIKFHENMLSAVFYSNSLLIKFDHEFINLLMFSLNSRVYSSAMLKITNYIYVFINSFYK